MFHIFMLFTPVSFWKFYCPSIGASNSSSHRHCLLFHTSSSHPSLFKLLSYIAVIFSEHSYLVFKLTNYFSMRSHCVYIKCYFLFHWFFFSFWRFPNGSFSKLHGSLVSAQLCSLFLLFHVIFVSLRLLNKEITFRL